MAAILGLVGTEDYATERFKNVRRKVFYDYPNGSAPLTGILSLLPDEESDDPEFSHYEKRLKQQRTETASQGTSKGPFLVEGGTDAGDPITLTLGTIYQLVVDATEEFRAGQLIRAVVDLDAGGTAVLFALVTAIVDATHIKFNPRETVTGAKNGTTNENVDKEVLVVGTAWAQGAVGASEAQWNLPTSLTNYCEIFRTEFSLAKSAIPTSAKFDDTGPYKDKAKEAMVYHMMDLERAMLFGRRSKTVDSSTNLPTYTLGGILWHMEQYELTSANPYGVAGATADTDDGKRIITNSGGTVTVDWFNDLLERCFRVTNNRANEKLVLCGTGALSTLNKLYMNKGVLNASMPMTETFGMDVVRHRTPFGTITYKTHPLFTQNASLRYNALVLDVQNLKYRYLIGRDTELLKNREPNDADYVKSEYLGEVGLEVRFPESHMYIQNLLTAVH